MADTLDADPVLVLNRFSEEVQLACPLFQRRYVWDKKHIEPLFADIDTVVDGEYAKRFLGTLVFDMESPPKTNKAGRYWIIDGQQRLTTLYLTLVGLAELASSLGDDGRDLARSTFADYLVSKKQNTKGQPRLSPTLVDSRQFQTILHRASLAAGFTQISVQPAAAPGEEKGAMRDAYALILKLIRLRVANAQGSADQAKDDTAALETISFLRTTLLEQLEFVEITLGDEHDPNEVFDRLNKAGERLGILDLIRNYVLKHLDEDPHAAQNAFTNDWLPFEEGFADDAAKSKYFFPFVLTIDQTATQATTFKRLSDYLEAEAEGTDAVARVDAMVKALRLHVASYNAIASGRTSHLEGPIKTAVDRLVALNCPSSIYPYVMQLLTHATSGNDADAQNVAECLGVIEAFLVRRAICGIEPTGLHAVFKKLWSAAGPDPRLVRQGIVTKTVAYPDDELFANNIRIGELYHRRICDYVLMEYERRYTAGDVIATFPKMTKDHVCPKSRHGQWTTQFEQAADIALIHTWANLVPLSSAANSTKGTKSWAEAKAILGNETVFATTKYLYDSYTDWDPRSVRARAEELVEWAQDRWPYLRAHLVESGGEGAPSA